MDFKGKGEINKMSLCEKTSTGGEPITELSLELHFITLENLGIIDMTEKDVENILSNDKVKSFSLGKGSEILSETFNIQVNGFKFKGESFTFCEVRKQEKTGHITVLRVRVGFDKEFYESVPNFFKKVIDTKIISVQGTVPQPGE